jgi:hypothetical protein
MAMQFGNHTLARVPAWYLPVGKRMPHHNPSSLKWRWNQAISRSALKSETVGGTSMTEKTVRRHPMSRRTMLAGTAGVVGAAALTSGPAIAGLVANASGLDNGLDPRSVLRASLWVPLALVAAPLAACAIGMRLNLMVPRSTEQGLTAARSG